MESIQFLPAHLRDAASKLPEGQQHTVLELPEQGEGHNAGLLSIATTCYWMGVSPEDTLEHLKDIYNTERVDYRTAPTRAVNRVWEHEGHVPVNTDGEGDESVAPQEEMLLRFKRTPTSALVEISPASTKAAPEDIIKALFDPSDIINIQFTGREAGSLFRCDNLPNSLATYKFLNPSTFKKVEGVDVPQPGGGVKRMTRCNDNVKSRPYMVLECDFKPDDPNGPAKVERFTTFAQTMGEYAPLVLVVASGNKSNHCWFDTRTAKPAVVAKFFALARLHGADKQMAVKSQIARMPNVSSSGEGRDAQTVLYYDPDHERCPDDDKWDLVGLEKHLLQAKQLEYYYAGSNKYFMQSNTERWVAINRFSLSKHLAIQGFRDTKLETELVAPVDEIIATFETDKAIEAALAGASGKHAGYYEDNGFNYLVLKSPTLLKPRRGDWSAIDAFFRYMFKSNLTQYEILNGYLSASIKAFRNNGKRQSSITPAQALHLAGDNNSGKSFFGKFILPALFGGRWADAEAYFDPRGSDFNSEMFAAELLILDDTSVLETSHRSRHIMSEKIKGITVGSGESYHGKNNDKVAARPWWRIFRFMNATPEQLATLPLMEKGVEDKWILLHAESMDGGSVDTTNPAWFEPWRDLIVSQLPAYLHYLLREMTIPDDAKDPQGRYAVRSFKSPQLMETMGEDSLETYLLHRVDTEAHSMLFTNPFEEGDGGTAMWKGTSGQLYDVLSGVGSNTSQRRFTKTCPSPRVLSSQLKVLEKKEPGRVAYSATNGMKPKKIDGSYYWRLTPKNHQPREEDCF